MYPVIAGGDGEAAAADRHITIGMNGIVAAVQLKGAAGNGKLCAGFQPLGAGIAADGTACTACGGYGGGAAADGQGGLRLDPVLACGKV